MMNFFRRFRTWAHRCISCGNCWVSNQQVQKCTKCGTYGTVDTEIGG